MSVVASESGNMPVPLTSFVGRRRDIADLRRRLRGARLLTLTGVGGVGKTRLAMELATASRKAFPDGVWLVDLAAVSDPQDVAGATAAALGVADFGGRPLVEQLARKLAERKALLVLDNCEHLTEACAELARTLLSAAPRLRILATSRLALGIIGEELFVVAPLPPDDALDLLIARTTALAPEFRITAADRDAGVRLCVGLDGLPLAIELAACRLRALSLPQLIDRLGDRFALLTVGSLAARPQQRTLRALMDWSYELCSPAGRLLWNRLSVFSGGFGLDAAEYVCAGDGIRSQEVLDLLTGLVAQSVVTPVEEPGVRRYVLLETIRQYGRQQLAESGAEHLVLRRHRDFFLGLAGRLADGWFGPGQEEALARLRVEHSNLVAALKHGDVEELARTEAETPQGLGATGRSDDAQAALALAVALRYHWCFGGFLSEGSRWLRRLLAAAPEPTPVRAAALWVTAWTALLQGEHDAAEDLLAEARKLGENLGDPLLCAHVEGFSGSLATFRGRLPESKMHLETAIASFDRLGETAGTLFWLFQLALVKALLRERDTPRVARRAVAVAERYGERLCRSLLLMALGFEAWTRDETTAGMEFIQAGLELQQGLNDPIASAMLLGIFAWLHASRGDHDRAARLLGAVESLWRSTTTTDTAFGPHMSGHHTRVTENVLSALGKAAYATAFAEGGRHNSPSSAISFALMTEPDFGQPPAGAETPLTRREQEVAALVAKGMSNRQIATALSRSPRTVDGHIENILAKLGFSSRAQVAAWWTANQSAAGPTP